MVLGIGLKERIRISTEVRGERRKEENNRRKKGPVKPPVRKGIRTRSQKTAAKRVKTKGSLKAEEYDGGRSQRRRAGSVRGKEGGNHEEE